MVITASSNNKTRKRKKSLVTSQILNKTSKSKQQRSINKDHYSWFCVIPIKYLADILLYNLEKDFLKKAFNANPPWKIKPFQTIKQAHMGTILDIEYLPKS